ncbi:GtrA family protein [Mumia zhuanghuii]|nr:GtrA family protein [Mumia zhuanghuii]
MAEGHETGETTRPSTTGRRPFPHLLAGVLAAGGLGWIVDTAFLWGLHRGLGVSLVVAAAVSFLAGGAVNFLVNRIVFCGTDSASDVSEVGRYAVLFAANTAVVSVLVPWFSWLAEHVVPGGLALLGGKVAVTLLLLPFNALAYHRWVFEAEAPGTRHPARPEAVADQETA